MISIPGDDEEIENDYDNIKEKAAEDYYLPTTIIFPMSMNFYLFNWMSRIISLRQIKTLSKDDMLRLPFSWKAKNIFASFKFFWKSNNKYNVNITGSVNTNRYEKVNNTDNNNDNNNNDNNNNDNNNNDDNNNDNNSDNNKEKSCKQLWWTLHSLIFYNFWYSGLCRLINDVLLIFGVYIIKAIIAAATERSIVTLLFLACILTLSNILQAVFLQQFIHSSFVCGSITVSAASSCVLHSVLAIRMNKLEKDSSIGLGEINNIYSKDASSLREFVVFYHNLWACPLMIVMSVLSLVYLLGYAGIVALVLLVMLLPIESRISKKSKAIKKNAKQCADKRMSLINQFIDGYKTCKLTNFSPLIYQMVSSARKDEMEFSWQSSTIENINMIISRSSALLITLITLLVFIIILSFSSSSENLSSADRIFAALSIIGILARPLQVLPKCVSLYADAVVSCERIQSLINEAEKYEDIFSIDSNYDNENIKTSPLQHEDENNTNACINLRDVTVLRTDNAVLKDVDLEIKKKGLYCIIGDNGSGKSSLLLTIMNELKYSGVVNVTPDNCKVAYCGHDSWIIKQTAKQNILMASNVMMNMSDDMYLSAIRACDLEYDFHEWVRGDNTIIDQNSISGGQRQRISICRALCSDASIYLFDSVLSGLDYKVCKHVFHEAILSKSQSSIVLLTTHNPELIQYCDYIIQLENGMVTYRTKQDYVQVNGSHKQKVVTSIVESKLNEDNTNIKSKEKNKDDSDITDSSNVFSAILYYIAECTYSNVGFALFLTVSSYCFASLADYFIVFYTEQTWSPATFLGLYGLMCAIVIAANFGRYTMYAYSGNVGSINIHNKLLNSVIGASFDFFNNTPAGRITSRFSNDLDVIDNQLPGALSSLTDSILGIITGVGVVCVTAPYYIMIVIPLTMLYLNIQNKYRLASVDFKRIESGSKSPSFSFFREIVCGLETIRGYRIQARIIEQHDLLLDQLITARMNWDALNRWLGCRLDLIGCMIVSAAAFAIAFSSATGGLSGLMLSYALKATQSLSFAVRAATAVENLLTSLDRVKDYCDAEQEEDFEGSNNSESGVEMTNLKGEDEAALTLIKVSATYAADLPPCLKSISFSIRPNELVGICGRSGSGKSTLALILSRLLPTTSGSILLGKQMKNINTMSLLQYRDVIKIFPQDSYIFSGTLRTCLDPSNLYTDLKLNILLSEFIAAMSDDNQDINSPSFLNLDLKIAAGGKNLSEGQKQIVNLCRALLTNYNSNDSNDYTKIIVLDEITSNLDTDSARKVIAVIKKELSVSLSVLLISHRQNDLEQCDNLIVLSDGEIIANGSPSMLMQDTHQYYKS